MHAQVLNRVVFEMKESSDELDSIDEAVGGRPLKEVLGHTPRQASVGDAHCCKVIVVWRPFVSSPP